MKKSISVCRICNSQNLQNIITLPKMPLTDEFVTSADKGKEYLGDIEIAVCESCGCAQNRNDTAMQDYYNEYTYSVQSSGFAIRFMASLAKTIKEKYYKSIPNPVIIEIGSGSGEQLLEFKKLGFRVLGIEPSEKLVKYAESIGIPTLHAFFDSDIQEKLPKEFQIADLIISSYTFDHIPQPVPVLHAMHRILNAGGRIVHEVHDLDLIKQRNEFCLFEHEHYTYLNERTMTKVLSLNNFKLETFSLLKNEEKRANSLLVSAQKQEKSNVFEVNIQQEVSDLKELAANVQASIKRLQDWLILNAEKKIVAYGAGGRGIMTIAALSDYSKIAYIVDKNPKAENIFAPKSHIPVFGIDELNNQRADIVLVFSFGYYDEIVEELCRRFNYRPDQFVSILGILEAQHA